MEPHRSILEFSALTTILLAHDLQHLLTVMSACVDALAARDPAAVAERELTELSGAIDSAFRLSRELLAAVGLHHVAEPPLIDVHELILRYQGSMRRLVGKDVHLVINTDPSVAPIAAAPMHVEWMLLHLLANARDAMPAGGTVYIETARLDRWSGPPAAPARDERYIELTIRDVGDRRDEGEDDVEPFFASRDRLGVTSVAATVRALKGWLYVERDGPGARTVHVLLPLASRKRAPGTSP
jgi:signal transduction histidine kinase